VPADPRIRPAGSSDRAALLGLWLDLVLHHRRLDPDYPSLPGVREALLAELERGLGGAGCQIWLAEVEGVPVGFLFAEVDGPEGGTSSGGPSWIHELYVEPDWRRQGLARALVDEASEFFDERGQSRFSVRVESANQDGLRFWRELGLEERARILEKRP
jgi:GNAT superfamily N-acetyltransferase